MPHATTSRIARLVVATGATVALLSIGSGAVLAGEVTGNGELKDGPRPFRLRLLGPGGPRSGSPTTWIAAPREDPTRGVPATRQSWGQIPKATSRPVLTPDRHAPGDSCNPNGGGGEP